MITIITDSQKVVDIETTITITIIVIVAGTVAAEIVTNININKQYFQCLHLICLIAYFLFFLSIFLLFLLLKKKDISISIIKWLY